MTNEYERILWGFYDETPYVRSIESAHEESQRAVAWIYKQLKKQALDEKLTPWEDMESAIISWIETLAIELWWHVNQLNADNDLDLYWDQLYNSLMELSKELRKHEKLWINEVEQEPDFMKENFLDKVQYAPFSLHQLLIFLERNLARYDDTRNPEFLRLYYMIDNLQVDKERSYKKTTEYLELFDTLRESWRESKVQRIAIWAKDIWLRIKSVFLEMEGDEKNPIHAKTKELFVKQLELVDSLKDSLLKKMQQHILEQVLYQKNELSETLHGFTSFVEGLPDDDEDLQNAHWTSLIAYWRKLQVVWFDLLSTIWTTGDFHTYLWQVKAKVELLKKQILSEHLVLWDQTFRWENVV